jgi:hypothetical protein
LALLDNLDSFTKGNIILDLDGLLGGWIVPCHFACGIPHLLLKIALIRMNDIYPSKSVYFFKKKGKRDIPLIRFIPFELHDADGRIGWLANYITT